MQRILSDMLPRPFTMERLRRNATARRRVNSGAVTTLLEPRVPSPGRPGNCLPILYPPRLRSIERDAHRHPSTTYMQSLHRILGCERVERTRAAL